jgi:hypothetical protein
LELSAEEVEAGEVWVAGIGLLVAGEVWVAGCGPPSLFASLGLGWSFGGFVAGVELLVAGEVWVAGCELLVAGDVWLAGIGLLVAGEFVVAAWEVGGAATERRPGVS